MGFKSGLCNGLGWEISSFFSALTSFCLLYEIRHHPVGKWNSHHSNYSHLAKRGDWSAKASTLPFNHLEGSNRTGSHASQDSSENDHLYPRSFIVPDPLASKFLEEHSLIFCFHTIGWLDPSVSKQTTAAPSSTVMFRMFRPFTIFTWNHFKVSLCEYLCFVL